MGPRSSSEKILQSNTVLLICLIAFIPVHLYGINQHGFWGDEAISASVSLFPLNKLIANRLAAGHFPTYFILLKYWGNIFGTSEASLRLPSLLFMTAAFGGLWQFSRRFLSAMPAAALLFLFLFFFNPTVFRLSQEARMYGPLVCTTIFCTYYFALFLDTKSVRPLLYCIAFLMLSLSIHAQAFILLAGQLLYLLIWHRRLLIKYAGVLALPLLVFVLIWQAGSAGYKVDHLPPSFLPHAVLSVLARAGMFAAGETDAYIFRIPPWSDLIVLTNIIFLTFLASCLFGFKRQTNTSEVLDDRVQSQRKALLYLFFLLAFYFAVMAVLGVLNLRAAHRVRYFITVYPYLLIIVAIGAVHLGEFLQSLWQALRRLINGQNYANATSHLSWSQNAQYIFSRVLAGCIILIFAFLYSYALSLQLHWKGPGYKEAILQLKENYQEGEPVITCCMPNIQYGFMYYEAQHINRRLHLPRMKSVSYTRSRIKRITGNSDRVWFLFYRDMPEMTDPVLQAFNGFYSNYSIFFDRKYPVARLIGYEKTKIPYDPDDPLGFKKNKQQDNPK